MRHVASKCCMYAPLQNEASHARESSANEVGASGAGSGFEGRRLTRRACAACLRPCNTMHCTHACQQPMELAPAGKGAGLRPINSPGVHVLHARQPATRSIARTRGFSRWSRRQRGGRGFEGRRLTRRSCAASSHPCNTRHRTQARCQSMEPAPAGKGAGSRLVNSPGVHVLHVREPATPGIARTRGISRRCQRQRERRGFEARRLTWLACAACSRACNTKHRTHGWCQPMEPAPAGQARA